MTLDEMRCLKKGSTVFIVVNQHPWINAVLGGKGCWISEKTVSRVYRRSIVCGPLTLKPSDVLTEGEATAAFLAFKERAAGPTAKEPKKEEEMAVCRKRWTVLDDLRLDVFLSMHGTSVRALIDQGVQNYMKYLATGKTSRSPIPWTLKAASGLLGFSSFQVMTRVRALIRARLQMKGQRNITRRKRLMEYAAAGIRSLDDIEAADARSPQKPVSNDTSWGQTCDALSDLLAGPGTPNPAPAPPLPSSSSPQSLDALVADLRAARTELLRATQHYTEAEARVEHLRKRLHDLVNSL